MKRCVLVLTLAFVLLYSIFHIPLSNVYAQDLTAEKAYQDYQYQQSNYLNAEAEYKEAKTFYKKNPTLQLREEARKKTLNLVKSTDQLMIVYLTALRTQISETTGFTADEKSAIYSNIDPEISWYQNHVNNYQDGDELGTIFTKSDESKARYTSFSKFVIYNTLFDITLSQQIGLRQDNLVVYNNLKDFINQQVSLGKLKIDPFNRWINDTDSVLQTLSQNETAAKAKIPSFYAKNFSLNSTYEAGIQIVSRSVNPLSQLNNYLNEMLAYLEMQPL